MTSFIKEMVTFWEDRADSAIERLGAPSFLRSGNTYYLARSTPNSILITPQLCEGNGWGRVGIFSMTPEESVKSCDDIEPDALPVIVEVLPFWSIREFIPIIVEVLKKHVGDHWKVQLCRFLQKVAYGYQDNDCWVDQLFCDTSKHILSKGIFFPSHLSLLTRWVDCMNKLPLHFVNRHLGKFKIPIVVSFNWSNEKVTRGVVLLVENDKFVSHTSRKIDNVSQCCAVE